MSWRIPIAAALALLVSASCDQNLPTAATDELEIAAVPGLQPFAGGRAILEAVTGSGHYINNVGNLRTLSFQVKRNADGGVDGVFQLVGHDQPANRSHGPLICFTVVGNEAWIGGFYEKSTNPALPGTGFGFYVKDNGQGQNAVPDLVRRHIRGQANPQDYCSGMPDPGTEFLFPVKAGNIQIHAW